MKKDVRKDAPMAFHKKKVLLVDDNKSFVMYLSMLMQRMGFEVVPAADGLEALKLIPLTAPDLVLLDINMPIMDGITTLRMMKGDKALSDIPVVILSIDSEPHLVDKCTRLGCAAYLTKPMQLDRLHEALQECIFSGSGARRRFLRSAYHRKVTVQNGLETYRLYAESLSEGGIFVRKIEPLKPGTDVEVTLPLGENESLLLKGTVIYIKDRIGDLYQTPFGMAIEFQEVSSEIGEKLNTYIKDLLAGDIVESQEETVVVTKNPPATPRVT